MSFVKKIVCGFFVGLVAASCNPSAKEVSRPKNNSNDGSAQLVIRNNCTHPVTFGRMGKGDLATIASRGELVHEVGPDNVRYDALAYYGYKTGAFPGIGHLSLAEFTLNSDFHNLDFYDLSLVDGYNIGMKIVDRENTCRPGLCDGDLIGACPAEQKILLGGQPVACSKKGDRDNPNNPAAQLFKRSCENAYSWSGDNDATVGCQAQDYIVTFCPKAELAPNTGSSTPGPVSTPVVAAPAPIPDLQKTVIKLPSANVAVPKSAKVVYRPLGNTQGGYQNIKSAKFPDVCAKGDITATTGPLFPFNENQTLVVRGPLMLSDLIVYRKDGNSWVKAADLNSLTWEENNYGSITKLAGFPARNNALENGREIFTHLPDQGEKLIIFRTQMPRSTSKPSSVVGQDDVPAIWLLNSKIFQPPSAQYFCNCRGLGNPGGCGELDIVEIIHENKNEVTTTLYSYEGAIGGKMPSPRPTDRFQVYAAVLRNDKGTGEAVILEADSFDFAQGMLSDAYVSDSWLNSARALNSGWERLNPP